MRVRWFGESWDAPMCEPGYKIHTPVGTYCLGCEKAIMSGDRGIAMAIDARAESDWWRFQWTFPVETSEGTYTCCAYHIDCHLQSLLGPAGAGMVRRHSEQQK